MSEEDKFLTTGEAAERLGISQARVRQLVLSGRLPAKKFGHVHLIHEKDLSLVEERKTGRPPKEKSPSKKPSKK